MNKKKIIKFVELYKSKTNCSLLDVLSAFILEGLHVFPISSAPFNSINFNPQDRNPCKSFKMSITFRQISLLLFYYFSFQIKLLQNKSFWSSIPVTSRWSFLKRAEQGCPHVLKLQNQLKDLSWMFCFTADAHEQNKLHPLQQWSNIKTDSIMIIARRLHLDNMTETSL